MVQVHYKPIWVEGTLEFNLSELTPDHPYINEPVSYSLEFYQLLWIFEGTGERTVEGKTYEVKPNRVFFMYPGAVHNWEQTEGLRGVYISFSEDFLVRLFAETKYSKLPYFSLVKPSPVVDILDTKTASEILTLMEASFRSGSEYSLDKISALFKALLFHFLEDDPDQRLEDTDSLFFRFEEVMDEHFRTHRKVNDYAEIFNFSKNYFNDLIREQTGKSASWWIHQKLILESKKQLLFTETAISGIASDLRFVDTSYFCRFFKQHTGYSPSKFRKSFHKNNALPTNLKV